MPWRGRTKSDPAGSATQYSGHLQRYSNRNMEPIRPLHPGDRVALAATARRVSPDEMASAVAMLGSWGLEVVVPDGLYAADGQLAGTDAHRAALLQSLLDDESLGAIVCCRGGYGTVRIVDRLDFGRFARRPKWIVGYSDVTVLHSHIHSRLGLPTLHATMPINFPADRQPTPATESLRRLLFGQRADYSWQAIAVAPGRPAHAEGTLVGGNLSILYSLLGSVSQMDTRGKILLVEDLDEYLYHIDRMMQALRRAGMLDGLAALVVGGLSDMHDNTVPFGLTAEEIVLQATADRDYPVVLGAPFGHLGDANLALPLGTKMQLSVDNSKNVRIFAS